MDTETTKAMQDALQAAVTRVNAKKSNGATEPSAFSGDMMGVLMSVVSKLLQGSESSEELVEKLDALQRGDLSSLREQVHILRKQCFRMLKSQEQIFLKVEEIQREQNNVARAVVDLAHHMARITFIDDSVGVDEDDDRGVLYASTNGRHTEPRANGRLPEPRGSGNGNGNGHGRKPRGTSAEHGSTSRAGRTR